MYCLIQVAKTKALISFVVTAKLICVFVFCICKKPVFSRHGTFHRELYFYLYLIKQDFHCHCALCHKQLFYRAEDKKINFSIKKQNRKKLLVQSLTSPVLLMIL